MIRQACCNYMLQHRHFFEQYLTEDFDRYVERKRNVETYGNQVEMQAAADYFRRAIHVYEYSIEPTAIIRPSSAEADLAAAASTREPMRLSYHRKSHYNSLQHDGLYREADGRNTTTDDDGRPTTTTTSDFVEDESEEAAAIALLLEISEQDYYRSLQCYHH